MQTNWKHLCQLLFFLPAFCLGQTCSDWIAPTSSYNYLVNLQMALDPAGNSYQFVLIDSAATFYDAGGLGTELMNPITEGGFSTVLGKYDPEGSVEWTLPFHSLKYTTPSSAGITYANGSLYVAGTYKEELRVN
ncbi:MAG: hypothetical protein KDC44_09050, partial [Phaeodactylibacter sp.]|nr:hypothetical protein [Phaeodactylibacter sp.]